MNDAEKVREALNRHVGFTIGDEWVLASAVVVSLESILTELAETEERAEKAEENRDELARALGRWQSMSIRHEARIQELEAALKGVVNGGTAEFHEAELLVRGLSEALAEDEASI